MPEGLSACPGGVGGGALISARSASYRLAVAWVRDATRLQAVGRTTAAGMSPTGTRIQRAPMTCDALARPKRCVRCTTSTPCPHRHHRGQFLQRTGCPSSCAAGGCRSGPRGNGSSYLCGRRSWPTQPCGTDLSLRQPQHLVGEIRGGAHSAGWRAVGRWRWHLRRRDDLWMPQRQSRLLCPLAALFRGDYPAGAPVP